MLLIENNMMILTCSKYTRFTSEKIWSLMEPNFIKMSHTQGEVFSKLFGVMDIYKKTYQGLQFYWIISTSINIVNLWLNILVCYDHVNYLFEYLIHFI